ncbi:MAG: CapA family protein [Opitutaceae bacterium]
MKIEILPNNDDRREQLVISFTYIPAILFCLVIYYFYPTSSNNNNKLSSPLSVPIVQSNDTITFAVVGDLMCHAPQFKAAKKVGAYDFSYVFESVRPYLSGADLCFGNLETVTAGQEYKDYTGYPEFNTPAAYLDGMVSAGFDVATNVNNHSLDRRFIGVQNTIDSLDKRGLLHTGTFKNPEDTGKVLLIDKKGIKTAVLGYTFSTNGIPLPAGKEYCISMIDTAHMRRDVERAKNNHADLIVVFIHWGNEYERYPNNEQKDIANHLANLGVDFIFGSHPHVLQPAEIIQTPQKPVFVIYSLGNFVSGQRKPYTDYGTILRLQIIKDGSTGKIKTGNIDFIPTYVSLEKGYRILPIHDAILNASSDLPSALDLSPNDMARMRAIWPEATKHLTNETIGMTPYQPK